MPETAWDATSNAPKLDELGKTFSELTAFKADAEAKRAALPQKPEDYKIEVKLPDTVKVPDGYQLKIDDKDPRAVFVRGFAHQFGLPQDAVSALVAMDAQWQIEAHNAEVARVTAEDKKLGDKAGDRKTAVKNWLGGLKTRNEISAEEYEAGIAYATDAATVTLFEKLIAKAAGSVPGNTGNPPPPKPADIPIEQRWYGGGQKG